MRPVAVLGTLAMTLALAGCTAQSGLDSLPAPIRGTVIIPARSLRAVAHPTPDSSVPVHAALAPPEERPGVAFRVLPHRPGDRSVRIAWVDSGTVGCGRVSDIRVHETTMQVVITLSEMPSLTAVGREDCTAEGVIHIQDLRLQQPISDRTTNAFRGVGAFGAF